MDELELRFHHAWQALTERVHANARDKGFWEGDRNQGEAIALMHAELSEALEALRNGNPPDSHCPEHSSLAVELADVVIRLMDFAGGHKIDVAGAILAKMAYNAGRPPKHGKLF